MWRAPEADHYPGGYVKPVDFPYANITFGPPEGMTSDECMPLRVLKTRTADGKDILITCWQPTPEERERIAKGEPVWLTVYGRGHPPVWLEAGDLPRG